MEDMQRMKDANQIGTSPLGIGSGYENQMARMQDRDRMQSNFASRHYNVGSGVREQEIAKAQNRMMDEMLNQDRANTRL